MKHALLFFVLLLNVMSAKAQIINGSFEIDGQPSLDGWSGACGVAEVLPGGAPGAGDWHARYPMHTGYSNEWACDSSYWSAIYQELPWLVPANQVLTIGFWYRMTCTPQNEYFMGMECRLAQMEEGQLEVILSTGGGVGCNTEWTYHTVTAAALTWQPQDMRALSFIGYDTSDTHFMDLDGIEILSIEEMSTGIAPVDPASVLGYYDPANEAMVIARSLDAPLVCFDVAGRNAELVPSGTRNGSKSFSTASLAPGIYTAVSGTRSLRFLKQ